MSFGTMSVSPDFTGLKEMLLEISNFFFLKAIISRNIERPHSPDKIEKRNYLNTKKIHQHLLVHPYKLLHNYNKVKSSGQE